MPQHQWQKGERGKAPDGTLVEWDGQGFLPVDVAAEAGRSQHPHVRVAAGAADAVTGAVKGAWNALPIPQALGGAGVIEGPRSAVAGLVGAHTDQYRKAKTAESEGRTSEMIGHSVAAAIPGLGPMAARWGEMIGDGQAPEAMGEMGVGAILPSVARGVRRGASIPAARRQAQRAKQADVAYGDARLAVGVERPLWDAAKPYLNEQHQRAAITSTAAMRDAADAAIGGIETRIGDILSSFPEARLNPLPQVRARVQQAFRDNPRGGARAAAARELDDLPLNADLTLEQLDNLRRHLNAENKATLRKNNYDQSTARRADPGFAAREATSEAIRDVLYDYLQERGVEGVRQLRRDEGALIQVRDATERQVKAGQRRVTGSAQPGIGRRAAATLAERGGTAIGAVVGAPFGSPAAGAVIGSEVGQTIGSGIRGARRTRDELIARAFSAADDRLPVYPEMPARRPVAGELPPSPIAAGPVPDTSYVRGEPATPARRAVRGELPPHREPIVPPAPADTSGAITPTLPQRFSGMFVRTADGRLVWVNR